MYQNNKFSRFLLNNFLIMYLYLRRDRCHSPAGNFLGKKDNKNFEFSLLFVEINFTLEDYM
jgi:hypothetical protein